MSKLVMDGKPLVVIPELAVKIGLKEAIVLQQIHYWVSTSKHEMEGRKWIYNSYKEWQKQIPFWSESTIKRVILSLEESGFLISENWNQSKIDKTKWYSINYEKVEELAGPKAELSMEQSEPSDDSTCTIEETSLNQPIPESTSEITTEKNTLVAEVIAYLNEKTKADYKPGTRKTRDLINAREREGFTLEDFKRVIDVKTSEWLDHPQMSQYLRPNTLFGTKFESYVNQKLTTKPLRAEDFDLND